MNKKILSVLLTLVMTVAMLSGCGSSENKNNTYFKEANELCNLSKGTYTMTMDIVADPGSASDSVAGTVMGFVSNDEGKVAISIKAEMAENDAKEAGGKIYLKVGKDADYAEVTTIALSDNKIYLTVKPIIEFIKKFSAETATQAEQSLAQMGITDAVSIDIEKLGEAMGVDLTSMLSDDAQKSAQDFLKKFFDAAEKYFADLQGQDGDDYTLTINGDNAEKAVTDVINFLKSDDAKEVVDAYQKLMEGVYGKEMVEQILGSADLDEVISNLPDAAKKVEDSKDDVVKSIKDANVNIISKASYNDGEGKITLDTGDIAIEDKSVNISMDCSMKDENPDIKSMIPEDASDVTTLLTAAFSGLSGATDDGSADIEE